MARIDKFTANVPLTRLKPKRKDWKVGDVVTSKDFEKKVLENWLKIGAISPLEGDGQEGSPEEREDG